MKTLLLFPPHCLPYQPWSTLPTIKSYLESQGVPTRQRDLNIETYHFLLSPPYLREIRHCLDQTLMSLETKNALPVAEQERLLRTLRVYALSNKVIDEVDEAKRSFTDPRRFYNFDSLCKWREVMDNAFEMISMAYFPAHLSREGFGIQEACSNLPNLRHYTEDIGVNPFIKIFREIVVGSIEREEPDIIGISLSLQEQILPGLTLSRMLMEKLPAAKVVLGGYVLSKLARRLQKEPEFFDLFSDYVVVGEGEKPFISLIRTVESHGDIERVPSILYRRGDQVESNANVAYLKGDELPSPDYAGFPLDLYFSPTPVLSLGSSRGCYWAKCGFCDRGEKSGVTYRSRPATSVVDDLERLAKSHSVRHFTFTDDAISPSAFRRICGEITRRKLDVKLCADARFETALTDNLCHTMAEAGFSQLRFGLESAADRVLLHMRKGTGQRKIEKVLHNVSHAGICVHLYVFFGFPTETGAEADETIRFVAENERFISSACCATFGLLDQSPVFASPGEFGVAKIDPASECLFKYFFDFDCGSGMSKGEAKDKEKAFVAMMESTFADFAVLGQLEWAHQFLYCAKFGFKSKKVAKRLGREDRKVSRHGKVTGEFVPKLSRGVICYESSYDLAEIANKLRNGFAEEMRPLHSWVLYDSRNSQILSINDHASEIIRLADGDRCMDAIVANLADRHVASVDEIGQAVSNFLGELQHQELLQPWSVM
jgi:anaerobic magnesium-protoporphyrin IX monomethyl ester cyclase